jgi:hypothetical protein
MLPALLLFLVPLDAGAITLVQAGTTEGDLTSTTISLTFSSPITSGNLIVVTFSCGWDYTQPPGFGVPSSATVADSAGNTYTVVDQVDNASSQDSQYLAYAYNVSGGGTRPTVTVTFSRSQWFRILAIHEFSGILSTSDPLDKHGTSSIPFYVESYSSGADGLEAPASPVMPTTDGQLIVGVTSSKQACTSVAAGTGFTQASSQGVVLYCGALNPQQTEYRVQATAAPVQATWTETYAGPSPADRPCPTCPPDAPKSNVAMLSVMATFKPAAPRQLSPFTDVNQPMFSVG